jgi:hypothetical protein
MHTKQNAGFSQMQWSTSYLQRSVLHSQQTVDISVLNIYSIFSASNVGSGNGDGVVVSTFFRDSPFFFRGMDRVKWM